MNDSRIKNSTRNSVVGLSTHLLRAVFAFITRTVFIKVLGVDYLGIDGLFANILNMLALSDLGIYTVMTYSLYKPLAQGNQAQVSALIKYFQKLYNVIALAVLLFGLILIPFLPKLIHGISLSDSQITHYYIILLLNSVISYFVISRSTLFRADQKVYIVHITSAVFTFLMRITQIVLLLVFRNFMLYLICQVAYTAFSNIALFFLAARKYPYLNHQIDKNIIKDVKKDIINNLKASFCYKMGAYIMNSTDNILISVLISTAMVGYFSNYASIYGIVNIFIIIVIDGMLASIGNFVATETPKRKYQLFKFLLFIMYAVAALCSACYLAGMNDFIRIWIGDEFIIGGGFVLILAFNRFIFCAVHPLWMMRESSGLFISTKYVMMSAAILNIVLSILLGKIFGINGIIMATSISYILTIYWYEPWLLSKKIFNTPVSEYWKYIFKLTVASILPITLGILLFNLQTKNILLLFGKFTLCACATLLAFFLFFKNTEEWKILQDKFKQLLKQIPYKKIYHS